ncbi:EamA family transporter [Haliea salexigens]|uniref:EamA family transporter n=1 Tax=Haliea salexigens TaxID=287487 RepID=UPI000A01001F|nr:EamA family transporter [Haliea salexigens]
MKDLNYQLKGLCRNNREGSYATRSNREHQLTQIADQLHELGFRGMTKHSLKPKHIDALVKHWREQGLSIGTIKNRMTNLRWWARAVNKQNVIARSNDFYGIPDRNYVANGNAKARTLDHERLEMINDPHTKMSLQLQAAFGLRREEALKIKPRQAGEGHQLRLQAEDALFKEAAQSMEIEQVILLFGLGGSIVFWLGLLWRKEPVLIAVQSPVMCVRMMCEVIGRMFYFMALALTPLSTTTAILQATPVVVVLGAALFFGERVSLLKWLAIAMGLIGVMIILRPNSDEFSPLSVLAVIGLIGFAGRDLASRAAPQSLSTFALGFYGFLAIIMAGGIVSLWSGTQIVWPSGHASLALIGTIFCGVIAYIALMKAMRIGEVSTVTPFRYSRLLFGVALGYFIFDEALSPFFWLGSLVIVSSGLFITFRRISPAGLSRTH